MQKLILTILLVLGCLIANAQWNSNPEENNLITLEGVEIYDFEIGMSNNGNAFICYNSPMGGNIATFFQIVGKHGYSVFPDGGKIISNKETLLMTLAGNLMLVDNFGNAIIAVTDCRNSNLGSQDLSYSLYKVSPTGEMLWGEDGIDISEGMAFGLVALMSMVQIEDGSYICAWIIVDDSNQSFIKMQRISLTGELLWSEENFPDFGTVTTNYPYLVNAGNNQVILMYVIGAGNYLMARKIDFDGSSVWAEDLRIYSGGFTIPPLWIILKIIPDQMGGAFVGWYDDRNWENKESTYVAHVTSNGQLGFASGEGGERVGYNDFLRGFAPEMYFDMENSVLYVAWRETSQGQGWQQMTAQKISIPSGELLWDPEGIEIAPLDEYSISFYSIQGDGAGNVAVFFSSCAWDPVYFYGWDINKVLLLDSNGEYIWEDEIIEFSNIPGGKGNMLTTPIVSNNYWLAIWGDNRKLDNDLNGRKKLYMQRININGTLGDDENSIETNNFGEVSFSIFPSVVNGYAEFHVNVEKSCKAEINLYSILGQKIETIFAGHLHDSTNNIAWNSQKSKLLQGVYLVTLTTDTEIKTLRLIVK